MAINWRMCLLHKMVYNSPSELFYIRLNYLIKHGI